MYLIR